MLMTHFWVLAGFSGFSLYGMTRSTAESGFWRRIPNLILISLALKEKIEGGMGTPYEHTDLKQISFCVRETIMNKSPFLLLGQEEY